MKNQPVLRETFKDPPILSFKGRSLHDILVGVNDNTNGPMGVVFALSILQGRI